MEIVRKVGKWVEFGDGGMDVGLDDEDDEDE